MTLNKPDNKFADVPVRVKSWCIIIVIVSIALINPILTDLFICILTFIALNEFILMVYSFQNKKRDIFLIILGIIQYYVLYTLSPFYYFIFSLTATFILLLLSYFSDQKNKEKRENYIPISIGIFVCIYSLGFLFYLRTLNYPDEGIIGLKVLILLLVLTELNDVLQYLSGKFFGKRKIVPKISPNKTVEGFLGGILCTTLLTNILGYLLLPDKSFIIYTILGILISCLGFCGDIFISSIKRKADVKDTGKLIPGHGGLLDRIDSLLFITPIYYWLIYYIFIA